MSAELAEKITSGKIIATDLDGRVLTFDEIENKIAPQESWMHTLIEYIQLTKHNGLAAKAFDWMSTEYIDKPYQVVILSNSDEVEVGRVSRKVDFAVYFGLEDDVKKGSETTFEPIHFSTNVLGKEFLSAVFIPYFVEEDFDFTPCIVHAHTFVEILENLASLTPYEYNDWRLLPMLLKVEKLFETPPVDLNICIKQCLGTVKTDLENHLIERTKDYIRRN